jgi:xanthine dehydrogenase accessory factor
MLASQRKARTLVRRLVQDLGEEVDLSPLYSPVGLDLGGRSPSDIAIAIAAEIQVLQYSKAGHKHLRLEADELKVESES